MTRTAHHQTTATIIIASLLAVSSGVLAATGVAAHRADQAHILADTAVYTAETATSRSDVKITVDGVWRNQAGDTAAVVMHAAAPTRVGEVSALPFDAGSYGLYLSGGSPAGDLTPSTQTIAGDWVVFGSTGYMAAVIRTAGDFAGQPFHEKVLEITVRSNTVLEAQDDQTPDQDNQDNQDDGDDGEGGGEPVDTFAQYDQWRVFFNPVAAQAEVDDTVADLATVEGATDFYLGKIVDRIDPALDESLGQITAEMRSMVAARAASDQAADEVATAPVLTRNAEGAQAMVTLAEPAVPAAIGDDKLAKQDATGSREAPWLADQAAIAGTAGAWVDASTLPRGAVDDPRAWERPWPLDRWRAVAAWSQMLAADPWATQPEDEETEDEEGGDLAGGDEAGEGDGTAEEALPEDIVSADVVPVWDPKTVPWEVVWPGGAVQPLLEVSILDPTAHDELTTITQAWTIAVDSYVKLRETLVETDLGGLVRQAINVNATVQIITVNQDVLKQFG
ncbi:MAG: hypothetical protein LBD90_08570 [Bifidobacteriaceae bacterium]|nr:hypothetical protein [Bifidobacteriaceae bacterium]